MDISEKAVTGQVKYCVAHRRMSHVLRLKTEEIDEWTSARRLSQGRSSTVVLTEECPMFLD